MRGRRIVVLFLVAALAGLAIYALSSPAPYRLSAQPVTAYRVLPTTDAAIWFTQHGAEPERPTFRGFPVFSSKPMPEGLRINLIRVLESRNSYVASGHACFQPRLGISFGGGKGRVEILICPECHWVYFYKGDGVRYKALSPRGVSELAPIAEALFGSESREFMSQSASRPSGQH
jgi:hypothetical protein